MINDGVINAAAINAPAGGDPIAIISAASPLGDPALLIYLVAQTRIEADSPLGSPAILADIVIPAARISAPSPLSDAAIWAQVISRSPHIYLITAYLSGGEDGETDYPITLRSMSLNKRSGQPSFYSIVAPFSAELLDAFTLRPNGKIHILRDGFPWESFNVGHPIQYDIGPRSSSISISGTRQVTISTSSPLDIMPEHVSAEGINSSGLLTLEIIPGTFDPRPNDTFIWGGDDYIVMLNKFNASDLGQTLSINAEAVA